MPSVDGAELVVDEDAVGVILRRVRIPDVREIVQREDLKQHLRIGPEDAAALWEVVGTHRTDDRQTGNAVDDLVPADGVVFKTCRH